MGPAIAYLASLLTGHGFQWQTEPGEMLMLTREGRNVSLRALVAGVTEGWEPPDAC